MTKIRIRPEIHFREVDYAESELLIFKYNAEKELLLLCFDDLSQKIPDWVKGRKSAQYSFRYKIVKFKQVRNFQRAEVSKMKSYANDFYALRNDGVVPIEGIDASRVSGAFRVQIYFERGFGKATLSCKEIAIHEQRFYFKNRRDGKNYYYVGLRNEKGF